MLLQASIQVDIAERLGKQVLLEVFDSVVDLWGSKGANVPGAGLGGGGG